MSGTKAAENSTINVRVQPRSSRGRVVGFRDGTLRASVTAPAQDGRANAALLELLADTLGLAKSRLNIVRGHTSRDKIVAVEGLTDGDIQRLLEPLGQTPNS